MASNQFSEAIQPQALLGFPLLPTELQIRIWRYFVDSEEGQAIELSLEAKVIKGIKTVCLRSLTPVPAALHTRHNSRAEGLKVYEHIMESVNKEDGSRNWTIYGRPHLDTVVFKSSTASYHTRKNPHPIQVDELEAIPDDQIKSSRAIWSIHLETDLGRKTVYHLSASVFYWSSGMIHPVVTLFQYDKNWDAQRVRIVRLL